MNDDPTFLGTVEDVSGTTVRVRLHGASASGLSFIEGQNYRVGQLGGFVRFPLGFVNLYGIISQVGASAVPLRPIGISVEDNRWITVQLVGEVRPKRRFQRGISQHPTVGDSAHLVTKDDLGKIYERPDDPRYVRIGHLAATESIPALIDLNALVTRHSTIVGATGSGKSTTVAGVLSALAEGTRYPSARVLIIDIHGEYGPALGEKAAIYRTSANVEQGEKRLQIPFWAMSLDELLPVTFGQLEAAERGALVDRIVALKREAIETCPREGVDEHNLTVDTPVPFSIHRLWSDLHCEMKATHYDRADQPQSRDTWALELDADGEPIEPGNVMGVVPPRFRKDKDEKGDPEKIRQSRSSLNMSRQNDALGTRLRDPRFNFLFRPGPYLPNEDGRVEADLGQLLGAWLGEEQPVTILDLSGVPSSIQAEVVGTLLRVVYDALFWARNLPEGGRERPLLVVLEEAHAYLGADGYGSAAAGVRRIAKEGRKYGIGVMLVSQRPSEIDATVLSQCGTIFAMRLANREDRAKVEGAASDSLEGLFGVLPVLRTGEAIIVGEAVNIPIRANVDKVRQPPDSADPAVVVEGSEENEYAAPGGWNQRRDKADYAEVVEAWRRQDPRPSKGRAGKERNWRRMMQREQVNSSNLAEVGYHSPTHTLEVHFKSGRIYQYFDVPERVYDGLRAAASPGGYLNREVKGQYRYARV